MTALSTAHLITSTTLLCYSLTSLFDSCTASKQHELNSIAKTASRIVGAPLPFLLETFHCNCVRRATNHPFSCPVWIDMDAEGHFISMQFYKLFHLFYKLIIFWTPLILMLHSFGSRWETASEQSLKYAYAWENNTKITLESWPRLFLSSICRCFLYVSYNSNERRSWTKWRLIALRSGWKPCCRILGSLQGGELFCFFCRDREVEKLLDKRTLQL